MTRFARVGILLVAVLSCVWLGLAGTPLIPGTPTHGTVAKDGYTYYTLTPEAQNKALTITTTPLGDADPDVYISFSKPEPKRDDADISLMDYGQDSVTIPPEQYADKTVSIGVYGYGEAAEFTILASFEDIVPLADGRPQAGSLIQRQEGLYTFTVASRTNVTITATAFSGYFRMYVGKDRSPDPSKPETYQWSTAYDYYATRQTISISSTGVYPADNVFHIVVKADSDTDYTITASTDSGIITLRDGVAQPGSGSPGQSKFYKFQMSNPGCKVDFIVTSLTGDPDLCVSRTVERPTMAEGTCDDSAQSSADVDQITYDPATVGPYYLSVLSYAGMGSASWTILAKATCGSSDIYTRLDSGEPQSGNVARGKAVYYRFHVGEKSDVLISLTTDLGDPDIYVGKDANYPPSPTNYTWAAYMLGSDTLYIPTSDNRLCANCDLFIAVHGDVDSSYTVRATSVSTGVTTLQAGIPARGHGLANEIVYFKFDVALAYATLTFTVTDFGRGDPDLYVSNTRSGIMRPGPGNYTWAAMEWSDDSLSIPPTDTDYCYFCTYFIGVYAYRETDFQIIAHFDSPILLSSGIPQDGRVATGEMKEYDFYTNAGQRRATFTLTVWSGFAALFTSNSKYPEISDPASYQHYSTYYTSMHQIVYRDNDADTCRPVMGYVCHYYIGVYGMRNATYTISAVTDGVVLLQSGVPVRDNVDAGQWRYFMVRVTDDHTDLSLSVQGLTGEVDMYVKRYESQESAERPSDQPGHYDQKTSRWSKTVDFFTATQGFYYIGVTSATNASFSIQAFVSDNSGDDRDRGIYWLSEGYPIQASVPSDHWVYFELDLEQAAGSVRIAVTAAFGDPDIFVKTCRDMEDWCWTSYPMSTDPADNDWSSNGFGSDLLRIDNMPAGTYIIGVYGWESSEFTITFTAGASTMLTPGVPVRGNLAHANDFAYYYFDNVNAPESSITVSLTTIDGDPDLYISLTAQQPGPYNNRWNATAWEDDSITIPYPAPAGTYYVAVRAFLASTYSIMLQYDNPVALTAGQPQQGSVTKEGFKYYTFRVSGTAAVNVSINLAATYGSPRLYVRTAKLDGSDYELPTTKNAQWVSGWGVQTLTIPASKGCANCQYLIGVYGETQYASSSYSITVMIPGSATELRNTQPINGYVAGDQYSHYYFEVGADKVGWDLDITVTTITGDPDLYVAYPEQDDFPVKECAAAPVTCWKSENPDDDAVFIQNVKAGIYKISVYGWRNPSNFVITPFLADPKDNSTGSLLLDGNPQNGELDANQWWYYYFQVRDYHPSLTIAVARRFGDPDFFVQHSLDGWDWPDERHWNWSSQSFGQEVVRIDNPPVGIYVIGVKAFEIACGYTIIASTGSQIRALQNGRPVTGSLRRGTYDYYQFPVEYTGENGLTIILTSINGDPDLYVSRVHERPNSTTSDTDARTQYREDSITYPNPEWGIYYIAVYAWQDTTYTLQATMMEQITLRDGSPQAGRVEHTVSTYYRMTMRQMHADLTFTLQPLSACSAYMYVDVGTPPERGRGKWKAASVERDTLQRISLSAATQDDCSWGYCDYYVEVYGQSSQGCSYTLTASSNVRQRTLQAGSMAWDTVAQGEFVYFTLQVDPVHPNIVIGVTKLSGDPDLFVNSPEYPDWPDEWTAEFSAEDWGSDALAIKWSDRPDQRSSGLWHIAVYGWENSTFSIVAHIRDTDRDDSRVDWVDLVNGSPMLGFVESEQAGGGNKDARMYYRFISSNEAEDLTITLTPRYGDPDLYVRDDGDSGTLVTEDNAKYWSEGSSGESLVIPAKDACIDCEYQILVYGYDESLYSITASTAAAITTLENGVPFRGTLRQGRQVYFEITVDSPQELVISVQAVSGDPDLYISDDPAIQRPDKDHHTWQGRDWGSDMFSVERAKVGKYYMGVYAYTDNVQFIVRATIGALTILNSQPVDDFLNKNGATRTYRFEVSGTMLSHTQNITFSLGINDNGDASMFIANCDGGASCESALHPNATHYDWSSRDVADAALRNVIYIPSNEARNMRACSRGGWCVYYITVQSTTARVSYTLTASYGDVGQLLLPGAPITVTQGAGTYKYYEAVVLSTLHDINVAATVFSGDVALYISTSTDKPNKNNYNWTSATAGALVQNVVISKGDAGFRSGRYYLGVYSSLESKYSLVVTTAHTLLRPGVPQSGLVSGPNQGAFFFLTMQQATDITLVLNKLDWFGSPTYTVYISNDDKNTQPGPSNYMWSRNVTDNQFMSILQTDKAFKANANYYIGVYSQSYTQFSLKATLGDAIETLYFGLTQSNFVRANQVRYYEIFVQSGRNFHLFLEPCFGDVDLYMSQNEFHPGPDTSSDWQSSNKDEIDDIKIDSDKIQRATFYIGVFGVPGFMNSKYELYATNDENNKKKPVVQSPAILAKPLSGSSISLSFEAATPPEGVAATDLEYTVYRAIKDTGVVLYSYCGLRTGTVVTTLTGKGAGTIQVDVKGLSGNLRYGFNVVVSVKGQPQNKDIYKYVVAETGGSGGDDGGKGVSWGTILGIAIPFFFIILAVIGGLWWKNRKLTKELEIEMHDVPKAAVRKAVRGPRSDDDDEEEKRPGASARTYTKLLTEDDDADYAPPTADPAQEL